MSKKKSAMQKGYRKQVKAKPFLTKGEIKALIIIAVVAIVAIVLFNLFYDDGFLSARQVKENDLVTYASTDNRTRYKKLAEVGELEGFTRSSTATEDSPIGTYVFEPETEEGNLDSMTVGASFVNTSTLVSSFVSYAEGAGVEIMEPVETTVDGHTAYVFAYEATWYSAETDPNAGNDGEAEAPVSAEGTVDEAVETEVIDVTAMEDNVFEQHISLYIDCEGTHTVMLQADFTGEDESFFMPHEEVEAYILQYADAINFDFEK